MIAPAGAGRVLVNGDPTAVRGGSGPDTRNPAGGADGVWLGSVGGIAAKFLTTGQRGSGGRAVQLAINYLVARRSGKVQASGSPVHQTEVLGKLRSGKGRPPARGGKASAGGE